MGFLTVVAAGQSLSVAIKNPAGADQTVYTDGTLGTPVSLPSAITADTDYYFPAGSNLVTVTVTTAAGTVILTQTVEVGDSDHIVLYPAPTETQQAATDSGGSSAGVLTWDVGTSDYLPTVEKAVTTPKVFVGPTDPHTVTGVVVNAYDQWVQTGF